MTEETYNGWANYETWALYLHITNDADTYNYWTNKAKTHEIHEIMDELKESLEHDKYLLFEGEQISAEGKLMLQDIGSIWRIDFCEVAKALKGE